jgi:hypothetical protein
MDCLKCKTKLLQQGAADKAAVADSIGDHTNKAWCHVCETLVCLPSEIPLSIYTDCDFILCNDAGGNLLE